MSQTFAPIVRRRSSRFPFPNRNYFDCSEWGGGFVPCSDAPGAVHLRGGVMLNIRTGLVYGDQRFKDKT